ncbi:DUF397 domain-containing protein [Streptomyces sp. HUAS TT20]|uniref:DUF397 domain-containing protein n=1 Tax=Streptomyces sp. HUAS TT20 TaxID=3447509 RepID=UPI0021D8F4E2|nr:DUF397 domain-containing protein [Streptomyces sp. HUAS 15-9]UXY33140.1 DUF397 domain-containing protein [Streptomyces sp. HUAS 15-9]
MGPSWSWRKSSYSDMQGDQCVEVAWTGRDVLVHDTKDASRRRLAFGARSWGLFLSAAPDGRAHGTAGG